MPDTIILGAGLAGLSAAYHLKDADYLVLEREAQPGGLCRTLDYGGFHFDLGVHGWYTQDAYAAALVDDLLGDNAIRHVRRAYCRDVDGNQTEYPYQAHGWGLPAQTLYENLAGLLAERNVTPADLPDFRAWLYHAFGKGIAERFMLPYNRKAWAHPLEDMAYAWVYKPGCNGVPEPDLDDVLRGAFGLKAAKQGLHHTFSYPKEGGMAALAGAFAARLPAGRLWLNAEVARIDLVSRALFLADGRRVEFGRLISTLPLPALAHFLGDAVPPDLRARAGALASNSVYAVTICIEGDLPGDAHWIYYAGNEIFHRVSFPYRFAPWMAPEGCSSIQVEVSASKFKSVDNESLIRNVQSWLAVVGFETRNKKTVGRHAVHLDPAYVVYDHAHGENTRALHAWLNERGVVSCGRFGEWEYLNMDRAVLSGKKAAEHEAA